MSHDIHTTIYDDPYRRSSNIKVLTQQFERMVLLMGRIYEWAVEMVSALFSLAVTSFLYGFSLLQ
jgi:hypothetical protein